MGGLSTAPACVALSNVIIQHAYSFLQKPHDKDDDDDNNSNNQGGCFLRMPASGYSSTVNHTHCTLTPTQNGLVLMNVFTVHLSWF